jgi:hypothetical protein
LVHAHVDVGWSLDDRDVKPAVRDPEFPFGFH